MITRPEPSSTTEPSTTGSGLAGSEGASSTIQEALRESRGLGGSHPTDRPVLVVPGPSQAPWRGIWRQGRSRD